MTRPWWQYPSDSAGDYPEMPDPIQLDAIRYKLSEALPGEYARHFADVQVRHDPMADRVIYEFRTQLLGQRMPDTHVTRQATVEVEFPVTWVDHWKMQHEAKRGCLTWWIRKHPPKMTTVRRASQMHADMSAILVYPRANIIPDNPHLGRPVMVADMPRAVVMPGFPSVGADRRDGFPCEIRGCPVRTARNLVFWFGEGRLFGQSVGGDEGARMYLCTPHLRILESVDPSLSYPDRDVDRMPPFEVVAREGDR